MSMIVSCDHCKQRVDEVCYVVTVKIAEEVDSVRVINGPHHLHWACLPLWGRSEEIAKGE